MDLEALAGEVAQAVNALTGLNVFDYPAYRVTPPAAIVGLPDPVAYDLTYGRGMDTLDIPLWIVTGKTSDRSAVSRVLQYASGSGPLSVKQAVDSRTFSYTSCDDLQVVSCIFLHYTSAGVEYLAAEFTLRASGSGV